MKESATRLAEAMRIRGMKQVELCAKTKIGKSSISTYLSGKYEPKQRNLYKIACALDVSEAWLIGLNAPMERFSQSSDERDKLTKEIVDMFSRLTDENRGRLLGYGAALLKGQMES